MNGDVLTRWRSALPLNPDQAARWSTLTAWVFTIGRIVVSTAQRPHYWLNTPHDDGNYVERALMLANGHWVTRFDQYTLIRGPLYPMYLAAVSRSGLALPFVDVTLQCVVSLFLAIEIAKLLELERTGLAAVCLSLSFIPVIETLTGSHVIRDNFAQLLLLAIIAVGLRALRTRSPGWTVASALGVGLMAIVREDAIWLIPWAIALVGVFVVRQWRSRAPVVAASVAVLAAIAYWAPGAVVTQLNSRSGLDAVTLFDDEHFVRAHQSLVRYINDGTSNTFTLTPAMLDSLAQRSPTLARLTPGFKNWQLAGGIVYVDAVRFALADGLAAVGDVANAARRSKTLDELSSEIDMLCRTDRRPACDAFTGPPPIPVVRFGDAVDAAVRPFSGLRQLLMVEGPPPGTAGADGPVTQLRAWERATNTSPPPGAVTVDGDVVHFGAPTTTVSGVFVSAYLWLGRVLSPLTRVAGMLCAVALVRRRRWRDLALGGALLACAYLRAAEVALAEHFLIGDYDFHYVQPAATLVHVTALIWLSAALRPTQP
jgi:hypothetical protein